VPRFTRTVLGPRGLALASLIAGALVPEARSQVTVALRARAESRGKLVAVQDVARVEGDEAPLVERVAGVLLGAAPAPGDVRTIARNHVKARLHEEGLSLSEIFVCGEEHVAVFAPPSTPLAQDGGPPKSAVAEVAPADDVVRAIRARAAEELSCPEDTLEVELLSFQWTRRPAAEGALSFGVARRIAGSTPGRGQYVVDALDGGSVSARALVWAEVVRYCRAVALRRPLRAREVLSADDLVVVTVPVRERGREFVSTPGEAAGREATRDIAPREPLSPDALGARCLVRAGDIVTVVVERPGCKIADQGRARSPGAKGQIIPVENLRSRKTFLARVVDEQLVAAVP